MIPGGFANLSQTPGTTVVTANPAKAEDPRTAAMREVEEEVVNDQGQPVLSGIDPSRLTPMDTRTLTMPWGERRVVIGFQLELNPDEARLIKAPVARLESDDAYRHACREHTVNSETGKPEICSIALLPLAEIAAGKHTLLHPDQRSLFSLIDGQAATQAAQRG